MTGEFNQSFIYGGVFFEFPDSKKILLFLDYFLQMTF